MSDMARRYTELAMSMFQTAEQISLEITAVMGRIQQCYTKIEDLNASDPNSSKLKSLITECDELHMKLRELEEARLDAINLAHRFLIMAASYA